jgi:hypothetical protein
MIPSSPLSQLPRNRKNLGSTKCLAMAMRHYYLLEGNGHCLPKHWLVPLRTPPINAYSRAHTQVLVPIFLPDLTNGAKTNLINLDPGLPKKPFFSRLATRFFALFCVMVHPSTEPDTHSHQHKFTRAAVLKFMLETFLHGCINTACFNSQRFIVLP